MQVYVQPVAGRGSRAPAVLDTANLFASCFRSRFPWLYLAFSSTPHPFSAGLFADQIEAGPSRPRTQLLSLCYSYGSDVKTHPTEASSSGALPNTLFMPNAQSNPVSDRLPGVDFESLPRNRMRAITAPALPVRPSAEPASNSSPFKAAAPTAHPVGTVTSLHIGLLKAEPALTTLPAKVRKGQRMATIRALGTAHPVCAPYDGVVTELLTPCGQPIEYGQPVLRMATA